MLRTLLTPNQEKLRSEIREVLGAVERGLVAFDAAAEDRERLRQAAAQIEELFLLVVAGEFNAGKSALLNALLGAQVLEEGVTPTTTRVQLIGHGPQVARESLSPALDRVTAPVELLRDLHLVDTPGTNAIHREHEAITRDFLPRADLVLFVTSADRPFTESERAFLEGIRDWGKKVVVVVNKSDILETAPELEAVLAFVRENARALLGVDPEVFPVSARRALRGKLRGDGEALAASRFPELEAFLATTLESRERVRLKLMNPLGVGRHLAGRYRELAEGRLALLREDTGVLDDLARQLALYREDLQHQFRFRLTDVDVVLHEFERRGLAWFDETMRIGRVFDLLNKARMKAEFEREVVADVPQAIDRKVHEIIDWMVGADLRQWQAVSEHLAARRARHADRIVGQVGRSFDQDRTRLLESVGRAAQQTVASYDRDAESTRMADAVQAAVASTALVEAGAVGLGALLAHVLVGAAADATGILAASVIAFLGLYILPSRREAAKRDFRGKIAGLRQRLMDSLSAQFDREVDRSVAGVEEAVAPYSRFVRAEQGKLETVRGELASAGDRIELLRERVESL